MRQLATVDPETLAPNVASISASPVSNPVRTNLKVRIRNAATSVLPFAILIVLWQGFSADTGPRSVFLPSPLAVLKAFAELLRDSSFYSDIGWSIYRVTVAFFLSAIVAIPIGILSGRFRGIALFIHPLNNFMRYLPVASLIPLCILWVGIGDLNKILVIFLGTVFQLVPLVADTSSGIPESLIDLSRIQGASRTQVVLKVVVPWCSPTIYDHCRIALGWAWSYLIVAELVATTSGIGRVIIQAQRFIQTPRVIAGIIVIGLLGLSFDQIFKHCRSRIFSWT